MQCQDCPKYNGDDRECRHPEADRQYMEPDDECDLDLDPEDAKDE